MSPSRISGSVLVFGENLICQDRNYFRAPSEMLNFDSINEIEINPIKPRT